MDSLLSDYPPLMTRAEVAEILRVSSASLSNWSRDGVGPTCIYLTAGTPRYRKGDVVDYLKGL